MPPDPRPSAAEGGTGGKSASAASPAHKKIHRAESSAPAIDILGAMDHPALFRRYFAGTSWHRWRVFLRALFALPMDDADLAVFAEHTGRTTSPTVPFKEAALICGRRGGKSPVLGLLAVYVACFIDHVPHLAAGEVATVAVIAADRRQARTVLRYILGLLRDVPALAALIAAETAESVTLTNRVQIEVHTAGFRTSRGYTLAAVLCDEIAFWSVEESVAPDTEILRALRPGLSSLPSSMLLLASSPYAKRGALYDAFKRHFGRDDARVLVWRGSTEQMNPTIDPAIIAEAREADPEAASAEYDANFRGDITTFVSREVVEAAVVSGRYELSYCAGASYRAFVDPSGGSADSMTLAIAHQDGERAILDAVRERRPPFSPDDVVQEFGALLKLYGLRSVTGDRYAGEWPRERFKVHGIDYELSTKAKSDIYRDLLPALNSGLLELLDLPRLSAQLIGLERRTARGGRDSIDHAPGAHDDVANAVAGVLLATQAPKIQPARRISLPWMVR